MRTEKNEVMERNETVQMMRNGTMEREMSENMADYDGRPCVADCGYGGECRVPRRQACGARRGAGGKRQILPAGDGTRHLFVYGFCGDAKAL